ncbi:MAG: pre-peptidase C-terminal domain-containing protein, partial [Planctomycetes bacterium]|nr:pre-peptidase C-terminal domain-containing protein [Planctomycetota bacterium]
GGTPPGGGGTVPGDDHGNDAGNSTTIALAAATDGRIDYMADADWFKLNLSSGVSYDFLTLNLAGGMDTILRIIDTNGSTVLAENDDVTVGDPSSRLTFTPTASAEYYLAVVHKDNTATSGTYQVNALLGGSLPPPPLPDDHGNDMASATAITVGPATAGQIENAGDEDWFEITLVAGQSYNFGAPSLDDTQITLYDTQGMQLAFDDDSGTGLAALIAGFPITTAGTYYVAVNGFSSTLPDYDVVVEQTAADDHGNDIAGATAIQLNAATTGKIELSGDMDYFAVDVVAGTLYDFRTDTQDDTILTLFDDQGVQLEQNDDEDGANGLFNSLISQWTATATATVYLEVTGFGTSTPDYTTTASGPSVTPPPVTPADDHGNDMASATAVIASSVTAGNIETAGDEDWFEVDIQTAGTYEFRSTTTGDTTLTLLDASGAQIAFNDDDPNGGTLGSMISHVTTQAGSVYLVVRDFGTGTPLYDLVSTNVTPVAPPMPDSQLASSRFVDRDGDNKASMGDNLVLTFTEDLSIIQPAIFPAPPIDPAMELELQVAGDSWGQGADMIVVNKEVTVTLGSDPVLRFSGTFNAVNMTAGSASGVDVSSTTSLMTMGKSTPPVSNVIDLESTLTTGFYSDATLVTARGYHSATLLDDGRVLVVGGLQDGSSFAYESEIHDAGMWTDAMDASLGGNGAAMAAADAAGNAYFIGRYDHSATKLANGQVLIAGGRGFEALFDPTTNAPVIQELASAFLFDPTTNTFTPATNFISYPRRGHYATLLANGNVLFTGGYNSAVNQGQGGTLPLSEVFDAAQGSFAPLTGMDMQMPREAGTAHLLASGNVLHVGGHLFAATQSNPTVTLYLAPGTSEFDMAAGGAAGPALGEDRRWQAGAEIAGEIFVIGGDSGQATLTSVEKLDPASMTFSKVGDLQSARARAKAVTVHGNLLVIGGIELDYTAQSLTNVATAELYNVAANVTESYQLQSERNNHQVVALQDGTVMVIGGYAGGSTSIAGLDGTAIGACERFVRP